MVVSAKYVPDRGDLVWLQFDPQSGHEQSGKRPALTISPRFYNSRSHLALFCPVTSRIKGFPYEVVLPDGLEIEGVALADQMRSMDWISRRARFIEKTPPEFVNDVIAKFSTLLERAHH